MVPYNFVKDMMLIRHYYYLADCNKAVYFKDVNVGQLLSRWDVNFEPLVRTITRAAMMEDPTITNILNDTFIKVYFSSGVHEVTINLNLSLEEKDTFIKLYPGFHIKFVQGKRYE